MSSLTALESLYFAALARSPEERAAFLEDACRDNPELRAKVERLLAAQADLGRFLEADAAGDTASAGPAGATGSFAAGGPADTTGYSGPVEELGTVVAGRYRLLERIGEGGMGSVFLAAQTHPVKRTVAVKLIKAGMDSHAVLARFEAERQALALMDHPNIAKVLDAGTTESGRPFFVMELVKGVPITQYCDERKLTPRQRLELFVPVCQAIQHAHQKGVIHRDIKPSNVLVALYDDRPVPKVIDFGVAKATGQPLTDRSVHTGYGTVIGTPQYMSPEQATLNNLDIDTRSDVYALGVLLYELLAGSPPFQREELEGAGLLEVLRVIREVEPPRPSTKLSTATTRPALSANRGTDPARLARLLRKELDWIVMKALEKDRNRRYETANGLAADLLRYLSGEPVEAVPPSIVYRLRKFVRRNKGPVLTIALVFAALVAGAVGTTVGMVHAERQRKSAEENEGKATAAADEERRAKESERIARERSDADRAEADRAREDALNAFDAITSDLTRNALISQPTVTSQQRKFLTEILGVYRRLARERGGDERSRARIASAAYRVAFIEFSLGRREQSVEAMRQARDAYARLTADFPQVPLYRLNLVYAHGNLGEVWLESGQSEVAEAEFRVALSTAARAAVDFPQDVTCRHLGAYIRAKVAAVHARLGRIREAEIDYRVAIADQERLVAEFGGHPEFRHDLATCRANFANQLSSVGKYAEAEAELRRALKALAALVEEIPDEPRHRVQLSLARSKLATTLGLQGRYTEAEHEAAPAVAELEALVARFPGNPGHGSALASARIVHSESLGRLGRAAAAEAECGAALAALKGCSRDNPDDPFLQFRLACCHDTLAWLLGDQGRPVEAAKECEAALTLRRSLADRFPTVPLYREDVAASRINLGIELDRLGRAGAEGECRAGLRGYKELAAEYPGVPTYRRGIVCAHGTLGQIYESQSRVTDAEQQYRLALAAQQTLADDFPAVSLYREQLAALHDALGNLFIRPGRLAEAERNLRAAVAIKRELSDADPAAHRHRYGLSRTRSNLALILEKSERVADAGEEYRAALALQKALVEEIPGVPEYRRGLGISHMNMLARNRAAGKLADADVESRATLTIFNGLVEEFPGAPEYRRLLERAHAERGRLLEQFAGPAPAGAEYRRAVALGRELVAHFPGRPEYRQNLVDALRDLGLTLRRQGKLREAEVEYRDALAIAKKLVRDFPTAELRDKLARTHNDLGIVLSNLRYWGESEEQYRAALAVYEQRLAERAGDPDTLVSLGSTRSNLGNTILDRGNPGESLVWYAKAIDVLTPLVEKESGGQCAQFLRNAHWGRARALRAVGRYADAVADWDRAMALATPPGRLIFRLHRAVAKCRAGQVAEAVAEAETLAAMPDWGPGGWYDLACLYGLAAGQDRARADGYADRAIELLRKAIDTGLTNATHIARDPDLGPLREREDFRSLLRMLEKRFPPEVAPAPRRVRD